MSNNWYSTESWYAPLQREETTKKTEKKKHGLTPARIAGCIVLLVLLVVASSLAFRNRNIGENIAADELPEDFKDYFDSYYQTTTGDAANIEAPLYAGKVEFRLKSAAASSDELTLQELYKQCVKAIVSIKCYNDSNIGGYIWGSGVILSDDGVILTNTHIIEGQKRIMVELNNGQEYEASVIGADSISDIAVMKIEAHGLNFAEIGDSDALVVGDKVAAIGNPLNESFKFTLTDGIVSGIERGMKYNGHVMNLIQTNTAINNGNSGGALFNMYGQMIGITNMKMQSSLNAIEGIGFAIPSSTFVEVANSLIENGVVKGRTSIGITVGPIPEGAAEHYDIPGGLYISAVSEGSDAITKGIVPGDILIKVNGVEVSQNSDVAAIKDALKVGDTITLTIWRDGETYDVDVMLVDTNDIY